MKVKILTRIFNRNGVSGIPFYKILFLLNQGKDMETLIAIERENDVDVNKNEFYVFNPLKFDEHYRGDVIGDLLRKAIRRV